MFIRPWLEALKSRWMPGKRRTPKRLMNDKPLQSQVETLEEKIVLSAFDLVTVIPNQGVFLANNTTLSEAPRELTLRFSPGQTIDTTTLSAITVTRAGLDGIFDDPATPAIESSDDVSVGLGYVGAGDNPNEVIVRFASTLPDDKYQVRIQATGANALGGNVGDSLTPDNGKTYKSFNYELDLGAQVESVIPQPVIRDQVFSTTQLSNLTDGDLVLISAGPYSYRFEINLLPDAVTNVGNIPVNIAPGSTASQIADALVTAINTNAGTQLTASDSANVLTVAGASYEPVVSFSTTKFAAFAKANLNVVGNGAALADGDVVRLTLTNPVTSINSVFTFELNKSPSNSVGLGAIRVDFAAGDSQATIAGKLATAINSVSASINAIVVGNSIFVTSAPALGTPALSVTTATAGLLTQSVGALSQKTDKVIVYFNQDQLNSAIAQDPTYYRLINVASGAVLLPQTVTYQYNPQNGLSAAVLTFASSLANSSYNLKVGVSSEPNGTLVSVANAVKVGTVFTGQPFITNEYLGDGSGNSSDNTDVDIYQFSTVLGGTYTLTLDSSATLDGVIEFLNSGGGVVLTQNATGTGGTEVINTGALGADTFYVRVTSNGGTGGYKLTIASTEASSASDDNSSFSTATNLGNLGNGGVTLTSQIEAQGAFVTLPPLPGGPDEPGHRDLPGGAFTGFSAPEVGHGIGGGETPYTPGSIPELTYSFPSTYGPGYTNQITPEQKEIIRQIFQIYSYYTGVQFREVAVGGNEQIVVGDIRVNAPNLDPGAAGGISGSPIIINAIYYANDNTYGGGFTGTAFHEIGHNLGLGHSYDVPSVQGAGVSGENVLPGDNDLIHLLRLLPNNASDIDLYQFNVTQAGTLSAQTIAQRLAATDLLNTELTLYRQEPSGAKTVIARNDDFYSKDSGLEIALQPGTYFIGVTSTGNDNYDPSISNSGFGGTSDGTYQLQLDFKPDTPVTSGLRDTTGQVLDGDHDGQTGGEYNTWFTVANTIFVDKMAPAGGTGTVGSPYQTISAGLAAAASGSIVRIVGNGGADGNASTVTDNVPYAIGRDFISNNPLADGSTFQVPQGVTVMIDAGALIKVRGQTIDVGTSSQGTDRSGGALQVLGTPVNNVTFTSWRDDAKGSIDDGTNGAATGADWGGIVFRQDSDVNSGLSGVFLNQVDHATLQYGGGQVGVDGGPLRVYNVIDLETSRPTIVNNTIMNNADAAISANPDSFKADDGRIGPDIYGNTVTQNSTNGLFIRIQTALGAAAETLNVIARFDDTDITHVIAQNLIISGGPAAELSSPLSARLMIDPGTIVKLSGARIETGLGSSNLIAEGTPENPIRFTSQQDDKFGAGGTFDLKNDGFAANAQPTPGNWSGIFLQPTSTASLDNVSITFAGGTSEIAGGTDFFNPIEDWQAKLRVSNSTFEDNLGGQAATGRGGRGGNDASVIYVRGAQPIIVDNVFRDNLGNVISINANSLQAVVMPDYGRSTGAIERYASFDDNYGPLVRLNKYENNTINGMNIRAEELTIESVWDDTDIAHVLTGTITSNEFHTYGGLRLQSSATGSLVVKLQGAGAGFSATGDPLEIDDRVGGTVQIVGQPGFPVILTSLKDDTVSTGFLPNGFPLFDTNNDGAATTAAPGDWNSIKFDQYSNDRNVAVVNETESALTQGNDINSTVGNPQSLGNLAPNENSGDENRRLGFEVHGFISPDSPGDVDVYSFTANAGTEVWIDLDQTSYALDSMVELVNSAGVVLARSLNSQSEAAGLTSLSGTLLNTVDGAPGGPGNSDLNTLTKDATLGGDFYTSNFMDAGFRAVLPGIAGSLNTYFIRVRSQPVAGQEAAAIPVGGNGLTSGKYELQLRLRQQDEQPGSTVRYADIRYATNGVELQGLPAHSIIMGESAEQTGNNNSPDGSQYLGPFLQTDRNTLSVSGSLSSSTDVDFYQFTVDYSQVQVIGGASDGGKFFPTMFDIDWADGLTRPDTTIAVYNSQRTLIYIGRASDLADDQPAPGQGQDLDDLSRGSLGTLDPSIGTVNLPAGVAGSSEAGGVNPNPPPAGLTTYYVAVFSNGNLPTALTANFNGAADAATQAVRLEPINSIKRVVEDHIGYTGYGSQGSSVDPVNGPLFTLTSSISLTANIRPFSLSDVNLFVTSQSRLSVVDPFNGATEISYGQYGQQAVQDLDMRSDGTLWAVRFNNGDSRQGVLVQLDTGTAGDAQPNLSDGIGDVDGDGATQRFQSNNAASTALAFRRNGVSSYDIVFYATADSDDYPSSAGVGGVSKLYRGSAANGSAAWAAGNLGATGIITDFAGTITTQTTGMQLFQGSLWGVSAGNQLYTISQQGSIGNDGGTNVGNPDSANPAINAALTPRLVNSTIWDYTALLNVNERFAGITDAPQNVENQKYADFLFIITNQGRILCVDPNAADAASSLQTVFDSDGDNIADSQFLQTSITNPTGLAFSPVDYNLWHPTALRSGDAGHGINTTEGTSANPSVDNSRTPSTQFDTVSAGTESLTTSENVGGASMYFGIENYNPGAGGNYFQYDSGGQYGVESSVSQQDLTNGISTIHNNYNVPGGTAGSLVTNSFDLEGYAPGDQPTLYFNYWLQTEGANGKNSNTMRDSARVYVSTDNGLTWDLLATNNSTLSNSLFEDAELPAYLSTNSDASSKSNQGVQELYETSTWRQARVDLKDYVGNPQVKLRFDFSTSGNTGTVIDPVTGLRVASDDKSNPTFSGDTGSSFGVNSVTNAPAGAQNNTSEGFYVDDIIIGFAGRGEMVTGVQTGLGSAFTDLNTNGVVGLGGRPTLDPDPSAAKQLLTGQYQLEIRRGEEYGALFDPTKNNVVVNPTLDINDRLTTGQTIMVGNNVTDGNTVTIYDGLITKTFEFDTNGSVTPGNIQVNILGLNPVTQKGAIASALASRITTSFAGRNTVIAKAVGAGVNSDRVDIFDAITVSAIGTTPVIVPIAIPDQVEDNDTIATATDSTITGASSGTFTASGQVGDGTNVDLDVDMYSMVLTAGQAISIDVDFAVFSGDSILRIFDSAGTPLAFSDDTAAPGEASSNLESYISFVAPAAGTYYFGVSGYNNRTYDPTTAGSGTSGDTFAYTLNIITGAPLVTMTVDTYNRRGDDNLQRQQGQFIVENNTILHSSNIGVFVNDNDRFGSVPHPGAAMNTPVTSQNLVTGLYIQNNVIAGFGQSGINILGDSNAALGTPITPFVKVVNNTIVNTGNVGVGINVGANTSPTLMNNAIVGTATGILIAPTSGTTEVEANLFQNNTVNGTTGNNSLLVANAVQLFVNPASDNYYPAPGSPLVDSSRSVFNDRAAYIAVVGPLLIPQSPIIAPITDRFGQLRVDDTNQPGPANQPGLGQNPFQDRGALERADFEGGVVIPTSPQDNDGSGVDLDPTATSIWIDAATVSSPFSILTSLTLQLIDNGIGIDDSTVDKTDFLLLENGQPLVEGADYFFTYNQNTNECIFTSVSTFKLDARYQIIVDNPAVVDPLNPTRGITDYAGNFLQNNQANPVSPVNPNLPPTSPFISSLLYVNYVVTDGKNDAPVTSYNGTALPASPATGSSVATNEDTPITFSSATGNAITVFDKDAYLANDGDVTTGAQGGRIQITISVPSAMGSLLLAPGSSDNLVLDGGSVTSTGSPLIYQYVLEGRIDDINTALDGITFTPALDYPIGLPAATVNITIFAEDLGKFGPPAPGTTDPQTSTSLVPVVITPINDQPTLTIDTPAPITILEDKVAVTQIDLSNISAGGGENQNLTITVTSGNPGVIPQGNITTNYTSANATGNIQFTAAANRSGSSLLTITVTDDGLDGIAGNADDRSVSQTIQVNVTEVNDQPTINQPGNVTVLEDAVTQTVNLSGIGYGGLETTPNQTLTLTATSSDQTLIPDSAISITYSQGSPTATLFYTPAADRNGGPVTITITAKDSGGTLNGGVDTATTTFTVTVTAVNDEPTVTVPGPITINEDDAGNPQHITLTGISPGPFEPLQNIATITVTSDNQSVIPDGNIVLGALSGGNLPLTITPLANQSGLVTITVTITDDGPNGGINADDNTVTKTFTINVLPVNDQPTFTLTPPLPPFTVLEDAAQQTLTLTGISAGPANESGQGLILSAVSSDPTLIASPIVSSIVGGQATVKYTPVANANGHATITVTLKDNGGTANGGNDTLTQIYDVFVTAVNDAPTLSPISNPAPILEDVGQQTINLSGITTGPANESTQGLTITAAITSGNLNLVNNFIASTINGAGQATLKYTPVANEFGTATVTVTITDSGANGGGNGDVNFVTKTFDITITPVNDRPTLTTINDQISNEDAGTQTVNLTGISVGQPNEAPPQTLTFIVVSDNPALIPNNTSNLSVVYNQGDSIGQLLYKAVPNGYGTANITLTLRDDGLTANGGADTLVRTFKITVNQVQDAPTDILLSGTSVFENQSVGTFVGNFSMTVLTDVDLPDDSFTYSIVGGTGASFFQVAGSQLQTAQVLDYEATPSFTVTVRVTDRFGLTFDKTFTINVQDLNDAPTLDSLSPVTFSEDPVNPVVINLTGISAGTGEVQNITITATSSNSALFTNPIPVSYTAGQPTGTLTLSPNLNANGTATITVTMHDNGGTLNGGVDTIVRTFLVTVNPVNDPPSDILLTNDTIAEIPAGTPLPANVLVGDLSSIDPDNPAAGDTFDYTLVNGAGSTDNTKFAIVGDELFAIGNIDFDTQPNYTIRVRSTDNGTPTEFFDKVFIIHSTNVNEPATSITTSPNLISGVPNSIPENRPVDSVVGTLIAGDPDAGEVTTFALVTGTGSGDNSLFKIVNGQLVANVTFNYEVKNSYSVRIRATDSHGLVFEGPVTISITNVNETPTNINLTNSTVVENSAPGTTIGSFSTIDPDAGDTFGYTLVSGAGATDNAKFDIVNGQLVVITPPNYEDPGHFYSIRVRSTDSGALTVEKVFTITILNVNEAPTALTLSNQTVAENKPIGTVVGTLGTDDEDVPESFNYALVSGVGSADNNMFAISGDKLVTNASFDFETRTTYNVRVRTTDSGAHSIEKSFTITINNANDGPVIVLNGSAGSTTGRKAVLVDSSAQISDIDSPNFDNGKLVVKIQSGEQTGDTLSIMKGSFNGLTLKTVKGHTVLRLGKQDIASVSGGTSGIPLTIQFGGGISTELFQKVMQSVTFKGKPFAAPRVISMQAYDDTGLPSNIATRNINVS